MTDCTVRDIQFAVGRYSGSVEYENAEHWPFGMRPHGKGVMQYNNGSVYSGDWEHGNFHGYGSCTYPDGSKFEGWWEEGDKHGKGTMVESNQKIIGEWQRDELLKVVFDPLYGPTV